MKRRNFLRAGAALGTAAFSASPINPLAAFMPMLTNTPNDRVLVLIRMNGGNDGLNTVIGLDQTANLMAVRPNLAIDPTTVQSLTPSVGLHPTMAGMKSLYDTGKLGIIQAVGYPNQNRSHFRSTDIWSTGSDSGTVRTTGWLGNYLNEDHPTYPTGYPSVQSPHPLAVTMGNVVSATCQGNVTNYSVAVDDPTTYRYIAPGGNTPLPLGNFGDEAAYVRDLIGQSNAYGAVVQAAANAGNTLSTNYPSGGLGEQLRDIAKMISGGLQTKIYVATIGGFDTHAGQVTPGSTGLGTHADLLRQLSAAITAFQEDLELLGLANRVLGLTFSEFGRRIKSNLSDGSDHGDAGPMFTFGNCVMGGILGSNPVIDPQVSQYAGVPLQYDFRDVYGSLLLDWFEVPSTTVDGMFANNFTYLPLFSGCGRTLPVDFLGITATGRNKDILVEWATAREENNAGFHVERSENGRDFRSVGSVRPGPAGGGGHDYEFVDAHVNPGTLYYYRIRQEDHDGSRTYSSVQTARVKGSARGDWAVGLPRPNPVGPESYVNVYAPTDGMVTTDIFDAGGRLVRQDRLALIGGSDNRLLLRPGRLPRGQYVWRLRGKDGFSATRKFIK